MQQWQNRIVELRMANPAELLRHPANWRKHPKAQKAALDGLLQEVGVVKPWLVNLRSEDKGWPADAQETLLDGHLRTDLAEETEQPEVPVVVLDLTEDEEALVLATLDSSGAMAEKDSERLRALLGVVKPKHKGIASLVAGLGRTVGLNKPTVDDPGPQVDRAEELRKEWGTERGQVWEIGVHKLMCGDCRVLGDVEDLCGGGQVAVGITSPPYASQRKYDPETGFKPIPPGEYVEWFKMVQAGVEAHLAKDGSWFVNIKPACEENHQRSLYVADLLIEHVRSWGWCFIDEVVWTHGGSPGQVFRRFKNAFEPIYHFSLSTEFKFRPAAVMHESGKVPSGKGPTMARKQGSKESTMEGVPVSPGMAYPSNVLSLGRNREALGHEAAFPVSLPSFFVKAYSDAGDIIYDPFVGSGTTIVACEQEGRACRAMEISPGYVAVSLERLKGLGLEPTLRQPT